MTKNLIFFLFLLSFNLSAQSKKSYLKANRYDLTANNFEFPQKKFKILGFGAYHGSAKTELAEYALLKSLTKNGIVKYYLPETDFSIAHFFNKYLQTGNTLLLKDLISHYGIRVPQEKSIETYQKWQEIKKLNDHLPRDQKITVVGIDLLVSYKYTSKHLLALVDFDKIPSKPLEEIAKMVKIDTTDYSPYYDSYSKILLKAFISDYEQNPLKFRTYIKNKFKFNHIINNIKITFDNFKREEIIFENYIHLSDLYGFKSNPQFLRFGFFHIEKEREGKNPSFFTMLAEKGIYKHEEITSVIGYLTKSRVLWDVTYDDKNKYISYTTEGGYGIGDYWKEYFRGIKYLKRKKISDITLFKLNSKNSPYYDKEPDLIEVKSFLKKSQNQENLSGKSTTDFIDYAILISNSKANIPIEEMK